MALSSVWQSATETIGTEKNLTWIKGHQKATTAAYSMALRPQNSCLELLSSSVNSTLLLLSKSAELERIRPRKSLFLNRTLDRPIKTHENNKGFASEIDQSSLSLLEQKL
jgi:hypothetical protein